MTAAYQVDIAATDDESISFTCEWKMKDGSAFPWAEYSVEYTIVGPRGRQSVPDETVTIDPDQDAISFELPPDSRLRPGTYSHGCRVIHTATGRAAQVFDGTITITEGQF